MSLSQLGCLLSVPFCLTPGLTQFVCPQGTNISYTQEGGGTNVFHTHRGTNIFVSWGGQTFFVGGGGGYEDVDEEIDVSEASFLVSEANIFVSEASKLSAGARISRGP